MYFFGKSSPTTPTSFTGLKKARGDGGVAGRAAEQARIFGLRGFDGIQRGGTDD